MPAELLRKQSSAYASDNETSDKDRLNQPEAVLSFH